MVFIWDHKTPALCITLGIIADDQTISPRQRGEKEVMFITVRLLAYEYEWMVAVLCMVHGKESVRTVCYPPKSMISAAGAYVHPLASLPGQAQQDGLLMPWPEITSQM